MIIVFGLSAALEILLHIVKPFWRVRKVLTGLIVLGIAFSSAGLWMWHISVASTLFLLISLYRVFNLMRMAHGLMHEDYLRRSTWRTSWRLVAVQLVVAGLMVLGHYLQINRQTVWLGLAMLQCIMAVAILASTIRRLRRTAWPVSDLHLSDKELPSISVAIPARNETEDLQRCLESIVASDYPKLEVLVLDDCSQTKRTPEIIRSFAHDGVRFIQGDVPSDTWLPKNQAYDRLTHEASGEYIVFCGADVRFKPDSLRLLVTQLLHKKKQMVSIMPQRSRQARARASLVQAMRYWWELAPPRRMFNRPAVLSSCWIISRQALQKAGGFAAVTRAIVPEAHFAKELIKTDEYSFMRSSELLGIESAKAAAEQRATAIRMRYPQLHRQPEQVWLLTVAELAFLLFPFVIGVAGFWVHFGIVTQGLALGASLLLAVAHILIARTTRVNSWWFAWVAFPFMVALDIALVHYSMWRYEFSTVDWKGRNICIPVMHVVPHLPKV